MSGKNMPITKQQLGQSTTVGALINPLKRVLHHPSTVAARTNLWTMPPTYSWSRWERGNLPLPSPSSHHSCSPFFLHESLEPLMQTMPRRQQAYKFLSKIFCRLLQFIYKANLKCLVFIQPLNSSTLNCQPLWILPPFKWPEEKPIFNDF